MDCERLLKLNKKGLFLPGGTPGKEQPGALILYP